MKKITEIYIEKEYMKSTRDAFGNRTRVPTIGKFKRDPILAGHWARIGHYLIDAILIYGITYASAYALAIISFKTLLIIANPFLQFNAGFYVVSYDFFSLGIFLLYYFITESTMQRSIGKFATRTVVIDEYGNKPDKSMFLARSFARIIPFDQLSCLGVRGWHDKLSKTFVVKESEARELRRLLQEDGVFISESDDLLD